MLKGPGSSSSARFYAGGAAAFGVLNNEEFSAAGGGNVTAAAAPAGTWQQPRLGIDRPAVDGAACVVPLLTTAAFSHRISALKGGVGMAGGAARAHALWAREVLPPFAQCPWTGTGVTWHLSCTAASRTRSSAVRLRWNPEGSRLLAATQSGELSVWNAVHISFEDLKRLPQGSGALTALEWSSRGEKLFVGDAAGHVIILSPALNPIENQPLPGLSRAVGALSASPLNDHLLAGCADGTAPLIWDVGRLSISRVLHSPCLDTSSTSCLQWHPQQALIVSSTRSGWLYLWDPRSTKALATVQPHRSLIHKLVIHPYSPVVLTCSRDSLIKATDLRMLRAPEAISTFHLPAASLALSSSNSSALPAGGRGGVEPLQLAINPVHSNIFVGGDSGGSLTFYSLLQPSRPLAQVRTSPQSLDGSAAVIEHNLYDRGIEGGGGAIFSLEWHPLGNLLASSSADDRLLRFWSRGLPGGIVPLRSDKHSSHFAHGGARVDRSTAAVTAAAPPTYFAAPLCEVDERGFFPFAAFRIKDRSVSRSIAAAGVILQSELPSVQHQQQHIGDTAVVQAVLPTANRRAVKDTLQTEAEREADAWEGWLEAKRIPRKLLFSYNSTAACAASV